MKKYYNKLYNSVVLAVGWNAGSPKLRGLDWGLGVVALSYPFTCRVDYRLCAVVRYRKFLGFLVAVFSAWGIYFQFMVRPSMEGVVELHDYRGGILYYAIIILFVVGWVLLTILFNYLATKSAIIFKSQNNCDLEIILTITPAVILMWIGLTSFQFFYLHEVIDDSISLPPHSISLLWTYINDVEYIEFLDSQQEYLDWDFFESEFDPFLISADLDANLYWKDKATLHWVFILFAFLIYISISQQVEAPLDIDMVTFSNWWALNHPVNSNPPFTAYSSSLTYPWWYVLSDSSQAVYYGSNGSWSSREYSDFCSETSSVMSGSSVD